MILTLPNPDLRALIGGETLVAFAPPGTVAAGQHVTLAGGGPRPAAELKPAYRRWADVELPPGDWTASVDRAVPAASLDRADGAARHILTEAGDGQLIVLRVYGNGRPVLTDTAFAARLKSLESALRS